MKTSDWNSNQYMKFGNERAQPSIDLINRIDIDAKRVLDIGCGPGNSTNALKQRFKNAEVTGVDASENMLNTARENYPELKFINCTVPNGLSALDGKFDLIFSNACIHWIPEQEKLLKTVAAKLEDGGVFAVQIPMTYEAKFYKILNDIVNGEKWDTLKCIKNFHSLLPEEYYDLLSELFARFDMWETVYYHTVDSPSGVIEWYRGSGLRPYLDALGEERSKEFLSELSERVKAEFPVRKGGKVILKMPRLFFVAVRRGMAE